MGRRTETVGTFKNMDYNSFDRHVLYCHQYSFQALSIHREISHLNSVLFSYIFTVTYVAIHMLNWPQNQVLFFKKM